MIILEVLDEQDDFDLAPTEGAVLSTVATLPPASRQVESGLTNLGADNDSVSTLDHTAQPDRGTAVGKLPAARKEATEIRFSGSPPESTMSSLTMEERLSLLEDKLDKSLNSMLHQIQQMMHNSSTSSPVQPHHPGQLLGRASTTDSLTGVGQGP